jgi:hypothetical protein
VTTTTLATSHVTLLARPTQVAAAIMGAATALAAH